MHNLHGGVFFRRCWIYWRRFDYRARLAAPYCQDTRRPMAEQLALAQAWRSSNPRAALATALVVGYTVYRTLGLHRHPIVTLLKHAVTTLVALAVAPVAALLPSSTPRGPIDPTTLTPQWITWVLREKGLLTDSQEVTAVAVHEFDAGKTGRSGRVTLTYSEPSAAAPKSVVVKMSRTDFKGRFLNLVMFLSREAHFFAEIGSESQLSIPNILYTEISWFSNGEKHALASVGGAAVVGPAAPPAVVSDRLLALAAFIIVMDDITPAHELSVRHWPPQLCRG